MSNSREDYRGPKAKITFNQVKKNRRGKFILLGLGSLFIALSSGIITAIGMNIHMKNAGYYLRQESNYSMGEEIRKLQETVKDVSKSVVSIINVSTDKDEIIEKDVGVGIAVEDGKYLLTSYECVNNADTIKIKLYNDAIRTASVIGFDSVYDIAMLKVEGDPLQPITLMAGYQQIKNGDAVISIGNPIGSDFNQGISLGKIINTRENIMFRNPDTKIAENLKLIKTNVFPRIINTGAALCNLKGELIGVNNTSMVYHKEFSKNSFYISVEDLDSITDEILDKQDYLINYLGIYGERAESQSKDGVEGIYAKDVTRNGVGYEIGIRPTDIITELNDKAVESVGEINSIIDNMKAGEKVKITVFRYGEYIEYTVDIKK